ncbi:hypothetical protein HOY80DRAFT_1098836 [Tuber brumale]|nr:hypothetical protein HOY80DRAFT_1098836 [Tuber brumale]
MKAHAGERKMMATWMKEIGSSIITLSFPRSKTNRPLSTSSVIQLATASMLSSGTEPLPLSASASDFLALPPPTDPQTYTNTTHHCFFTAPAQCNQAFSHLGSAAKGQPLNEFHITTKSSSSLIVSPIRNSLRKLSPRRTKASHTKLTQASYWGVFWGQSAPSSDHPGMQLDNRYTTAS